MKWRYKYEECGGYDSMTGSFNIFIGDMRVAVIDQRDFGENPCEYEKIPEAEAMAKFIVDACNRAEERKL